MTINVLVSTLFSRNPIAQRKLCGKQGHILKQMKWKSNKNLNTMLIFVQGGIVNVFKNSSSHFCSSFSSLSFEYCFSENIFGG